jgi:hypothetical protein
MWQPPPGFPFNCAAPPWAGGGVTASAGGATAAAGPGGAFAAGPAFGGSAAWMGATQPWQDPWPGESAALPSTVLFTLQGWRHCQSLPSPRCAAGSPFSSSSSHSSMCSSKCSSGSSSRSSRYRTPCRELEAPGKKHSYAGSATCERRLPCCIAAAAVTRACVRRWLLNGAWPARACGAGARRAPCRAAAMMPSALSTC